MNWYIRPERRTAKALGLAVPLTLQVGADERSIVNRFSCPGWVIRDRAELELSPVKSAVPRKRKKLAPLLQRVDDARRRHRRPPSDQQASRGGGGSPGRGLWCLPRYRYAAGTRGGAAGLTRSRSGGQSASVPTISSNKVGTAQARLCPPYDPCSPSGNTPRLDSLCCLGGGDFDVFCWCAAARFNRLCYASCSGWIAIRNPVVRGGRIRDRQMRRLRPGV